MAEYGLIKDDTMAAIASAIREKGGAESSLLPSAMADAIRSISGGGGDLSHYAAVTNAGQPSGNYAPRYNCCSGIDGLIIYGNAGSSYGRQAWFTFVPSRRMTLRAYDVSGHNVNNTTTVICTWTSGTGMNASSHAISGTTEVVATWYTQGVQYGYNGNLPNAPVDITLEAGLYYRCEFSRTGAYFFVEV